MAKRRRRSGGKLESAFAEDALERGAMDVLRASKEGNCRKVEDAAANLNLQAKAILQTEPGMGKAVRRALDSAKSYASKAGCAVSLGSAPEVHREGAKEALREIKANALQAERAARARQCAPAMHGLLDAAENFGILRAHEAGAGEGETPGSQPALEQYNEAAQAFQDHCIIKK